MSMSKLKMKIGLKQILSGILTFMLVFTSVPFAGFTTHAATEYEVKDGSSSKDLQDIITSARDNDIIEINGTVTIDRSIRINSGKKLTLQGSGTLKRAKGFKYNMLDISSKSNVTIKGITVDGNKAEANEILLSAVQIDMGSSLTMESGTIKDNCPAKFGGGVFNNGTFIMKGGTIKDNRATESGGGVYNCSDGLRAIFEMTGGTITGNEVGHNGGGVKNCDGTFTMSGGTISENDGGGVYNGDGSKSGTFKMIEGTLPDGTKTNGTISKNGGSGVHNYNGDVTMEKGIISENYGEGVYNQRTFTMKDGIISKNSDEGVKNCGRDFIMSGGTISENRKGGVYNSGTFTMSEGTISKNASDYGGGVYNDKTFEMTGGTISGNTAVDGGGVYSNGAFKVQGTATVNGNGENNNVRFISANKNITVVGKFNGSIGLKQDLDKVAVNAANNYKLTKDDLEHFFTDDLDNHLELINNTLVYKSGRSTNYIQDEINNAADGDTITIDDTISIDNTIEIYKNITLKGKGTLLRSEGLKGKMLNIGSNTNVTIEGITIDGNNIDDSTGSAVYINGGSSLIMKGGTIKNNIADNGGGVYVDRGGNLKVQGKATIINNGKNKNDNVRFASADSYITVLGKFRGLIGLKQNFYDVAVMAAEGYTLTKYDINCFVTDSLNAHLEYMDGKLIYTKDRTGWGQMVQSNGVTYYINKNGRASAEVIGNGNIWLNTKSDGSGSWYCIDNSQGTFKIGSRFYVQIIDDISKYYNKIGSKYRDKIEDGKLKIFLIGVIDPDGNEYTNLDTEMDCYVKVNPNWDKDKIKAIFINGENTEKVDIEYMGLLKSPSNGDKFIRLTLKHFSPYAIYQAKSEDNVQNNVIAEDNALDTFATGENVNYVYILGFSTMAIAALAGVMFIKRKFNR